MTQLCGAGAVLVGTIAFALLLDQLDAIYVMILSAWAGAGMAALICGGWAARPSPTNLVICASIDAAFCGVLVAVASRLPLWLRAMAPGDVEQASAVVTTLAVASGVTCFLCLLATPRSLRYWRNLERVREAEPEPLTPANTAPGFPPPVTTGAFLAGADFEPAPPSRPAPAVAMTFAPAVARSSNQSTAVAAPLGGPAMGAMGPGAMGAMGPGAMGAMGPGAMGAMGPGAPQPWAPPVQAAARPAAAPSWPAQPAPGYALAPSAYAARAPSSSPLPLPPGFDGTPPPYLEPRLAPPAPFPGPAPVTPPVPSGYAPPGAAGPIPTPPGFALPAQPAPATPPRRRGALVLALGLTVGCAAALVFALVSADRGATTSTTSSPKTPATKAPATPAAAPLAPSALPAPATPNAPAESLPTVEALLEELHRVVARADEKAVQRLLWPKAFAFSVRATGRNDHAEAVASAWARDLGAPPPLGFTVEPRGTAIGQEGNAAWIAEELLVSGGGQERTFAVSMLAASIGGSWKIVAWHWAVRLPDEEVERRLEEGELPIPESFDDRVEAPEEAVEAFREAFSSPAAFALTVSSRPTAFNFGSAPRERLLGGDSIRRVFRKLSVELALGEGVMVVSSGAWDEAQRAAPQVAWAAANVEFVAKRSRRPLRVLAVLIKEGAEWRIVQTQWSDGL